MTTMRTMKRINNCRDMLNKAICPRMRLMWKRNYEFLLNTYVKDINGRRISAAREIH